MKKLLKYLAVVALISTAQYFLLNETKIQSETLGNIMTFLGIIFGFYITSLSIFVISKYVGSLYRIVDKEDTSRTLLNTLVSNYRFGLISALLTVAYLVSVQLFIDQSNAGSASMSNFILKPFLGIIVINFWYSYKMLSDLINIIIQEAKNNS